MYEIYKCHDAIKGPNDPECASMDEINEWLTTKKVHIKIVDSKIDFKWYGEYAVRQTEKWMPMIDLTPGLFSDTGYRFRKNTFHRHDEWYPFHRTVDEEFYD